MDPAVRKYLAGHECPETMLAMPLVAREMGWSHVLVVPVHAEDPSFVEGYRAALGAAKGHGLVIAVLNGRREDTHAARERDLQTLTHFEARGEVIEVPEARGVLCKYQQFDLLAIDRVSEGRAFERGQGVGLARKIGCDVAVGLSATGAIRRAWIHCTDADAKLPRDYLAHLNPDPKVLASIAPFVHVDDGDAEALHATQRYEARLRWYVQGLRWSGSAFAHHSLGSTISVRPHAYAKVRGFPRREAGEDFYLLDKLAKLAKIECRRGTPIFLRARRSTRVPFGTGPAVERALDGEDISFYDPAVFEALLRVHGALRVMATTSRRAEALEAHDRVADAAHMGAAMGKVGLRSKIEEITERYPSRQWGTRMREYFDGLKTLQFVHALERDRWPSKSLDAVWAEAEFLGPGRHGLRSLRERLDFLRAREGIRAGL